MVRSSLRTCVALAVVLTLGSVCSGVDRNYLWTGRGADNLWSNPNNWDLDGTGSPVVPTDGPNDYAFIQGLGSQTNPPLIQDGIEAVCGILTAERHVLDIYGAGDPVMNMTGGTLEVTGWGVWWGDDAGCRPTFNMSGGEINLTGSPGILEIGWQEEGDPPGSCKGTWNMTGGVINAKGVSIPANYGNGADGELNLYGGQINVGTAEGGLSFHNNWGDGLINITRGTLKLEGDDQTALVEGYEAQGWLVAYDGLGELHCEYDGFGTTTVTATIRDGDANGDDLVNSADASILGAHWLQASGARWGDGDFDFDGAVNDADAAILAANWYEGPGAEAPEPSVIAMLLGLLGFALCARRR
jgi:hypothetical protein